MPIILTDYNKMVVGKEVVHEGVPPVPPLERIRRELPPQTPFVEVIHNPIKPSAYRKDMLTSGE